MKTTTTTPKKGDNTYLYLGIALLAGVGLYAMNGNSNTEPTDDLTTDTPSSTPAAAKPDLNKVLSLGSRGLEVGKLQLLMGMSGREVDGIFGPITEKKLLTTKGVKQVTLAQYPTLPTLIIVPVLPLNTNIQAKNPQGVKVYGAVAKADGSYYSSGNVVSTFDYGEKVGLIKSTMNASGYYLIYYYGMFNALRKGFVKASDIEKI